MKDFILSVTALGNQKRYQLTWKDMGGVVSKLPFTKQLYNIKYTLLTFCIICDM